VGRRRSSSIPRGGEKKKKGNGEEKGSAPWGCGQARGPRGSSGRTGWSYPGLFGPGGWTEAAVAIETREGPEASGVRGPAAPKVTVAKAGLGKIGLGQRPAWEGGLPMAGPKRTRGGRVDLQNFAGSWKKVAGFAWGRRTRKNNRKGKRRRGPSVEERLAWALFPEPRKVPGSICSVPV